MKSLFTGKCISFVCFIGIMAAVILISSGGRSAVLNETAGADSLKGLKDYYKDFFPIGVAVEPNSLEGALGELIKKHFNSLTAENVMKPGPIHPEENRYAWENADRIVDFAQKNGMKMRGHTLCWHNQTGAWMFKDSQGNQVGKEIALQRLKDHIKHVVTRYKGKVYAWDVVNEAVVDDNDPVKVFRETPWLKICGEEYIALAFKYAHEADPDALLFYNDYNTENPVKREKIYNMVKKMISEGVPVHGVGLQGHWKTDNPSEENIRKSIERFSSLGIKVQITELDVTIYTSRTDTVGMGFTPDREKKQSDFYRMAFKVFRENQTAISGVTFWNITDARSWLDRPNKKVYPLLFDGKLKPKKAYWEVVNF